MKNASKTKRPPIPRDRGAGLTFSEAVDKTLADETLLSASAVVDRFKELLGLDSDTALTEVLGTSRQNIWKWRRRNAVPYREAVFLALWAGASLDYLLTGRGPRKFRIPPNDRGDYELLRQILYSAARSPDAPLTPALSLRIAKAYENAEATMARLIEEEGLPDDQARNAALAAVDPFDVPPTDPD